MEKIFYFLFMVFIQSTCYAQTTKPTPPKDDDSGWNNRISFFIGGGAAAIGSTVYELPVIEKATNHVIIEKSGFLKTNISTGIVFSPEVYNVTRTISYYDTNGEKQIRKVMVYEPRGWSAALFINPISLASVNSNLNNTVDLGFGFGYRHGSFAAFGTVEFFGLKQPREYFIKRYESNDKQYVTDGQIQTAIDINDNSIFRTEIITSFGFKLAYTFDIVNRFATAANGQ